MAQEIEYHDAMIRMLELIWGEGYMSPGGPAKTDELVTGLQLAGKTILDIGSGLGGPACRLAEAHGARVTGVDIEPQLIGLSRQRARDRGLGQQVDFVQVVPDRPLPFADEAFDGVVSAGAFTQIPGKHSLFAECLRVLKPGGTMRNYEWTTSRDQPSRDMRYFFEMEGLTYALETPESYERLLSGCGFTEIRLWDDTPWYRLLCRQEYEAMRGPMYDDMVELLGKADADHFVEDWRSMVVVCEKGELTQTYCHSIKPR